MNQPKRRMPPKSLINLSIKVHKGPRIEDENIEVAKCSACGKYFEKIEGSFIKDTFTCFNCFGYKI
jgi:formylmethanofuran dehydrogenase subunit E